MMDSRAQWEGQWRDLCKDLASLLLAWRRNVSLKVYLSGTRNEFIIHSVTQDRSRILSKCQMLVDSRFITAESLSSWVPCTAKTSKVTIQGAFSLQPHATKHIQFSSLGIYPITFPDVKRPLHDEINRLFAQSRFGFEQESHDGDRAKESNLQSIAAHGRGSRPTRSIDRWPMFYINITLHTEADGDSPTPVSQVSESKWSEIFDLLRMMVIEFLKQHNLDSKHMARQKSQPLIPIARSKPTTEFNGLNTCSASDDARNPVEVQPGARVSFNNDGRTSVSLVSRGGVVSRAPFADKTLAPRCRSVPPMGLPTADRQNAGQDCLVTNQDSSKILEWTNPVTQVRSLVDTRTGHTTRADSANVPSTKRLTSSSRSRSCQGAPDPWVDSILSNWVNPVFPSAEQDIRCIEQDGFITKRHDIASTYENRASCSESHECHDTLKTGTTFTMSKHALKHARVIAQVAKKFILLSVQDAHEQNSTLVLIDQHAADERIRIEALFREYCTLSPETPARHRSYRLETPLVFEISSDEALLVSKHSQFLWHWGFQVSVNVTSMQASSSRAISVECLPYLLAERCRSDPPALLDLIRSEIYAQEDRRRERPNNVEPLSIDEHEQTPSWLHAMSECPRGIVKMLNSRACRSAIMFNDVLSLADCQRLILELAACAFPFQCAHGRPSLVTLVTLGRLSALDSLLGPELGMSEGTTVL